MAGTIKIRLDKEGKTHIEVDGCSGTTCEDITKVLTQGLGETEEHVQKLEAYDNTEPDYVSNLEGG